MTDFVNYIAPDLTGEGLKIGIVMSRFNEPFCLGLKEACLSQLTALGVAPEDITLASVPGALEIPVALQSMAESDLYDALIALGCVIRGDTYHFEIVSNESAAGIAKIALEYNLPIANAVLTTENEAQAQARLQEKGRAAASVAVEMANICLALNDLSDDDFDA